jgi:hypothetical protein
LLECNPTLARETPPLVLGLLVFFGLLDARVFPRLALQLKEQNPVLITPLLARGALLMVFAIHIGRTGALPLQP